MFITNVYKRFFKIFNEKNSFVKQLFIIFFNVYYIYGPYHYRWSGTILSSSTLVYSYTPDGRVIAPSTPAVRQQY